MVDGVVVVDKPAGMTSHDVVTRLRRVFGQRKVGHAGTLDPDATGVLLVGLGSATRLLRYLQDTDKEYAGTVVFGVATDTLDASGAVIATADMHGLTRDDIARAADRFIGDIEQIPPMVSAIKVGGRRLHELARAGTPVERAPRRVRIDTITITAFRPGARPEVDLDIVCSSGTYVRALAADLGTALGGGAHLGRLRRTRVGSFTLGESSSLDEIERRSLELVRTPLEALRDLDRIEVDGEVARSAGHGRRLPTGDLLAPDAGPGPFALAAGGRLLAVYERHADELRPAVVVPPPAR
jgi:tRNA pseudouridine55 synthase